ncbi:hypothetical protein [Crossiella sp. CA198]|uniref:hypothetical protein n=1 Tax=Crossiella sp. CA198 TaxID=3455607 RepID=UPI003F8D8B67
MAIDLWLFEIIEHVSSGVSSGCEAGDLPEVIEPMLASPTAAGWSMTRVRAWRSSSVAGGPGSRCTRAVDSEL